MNLYALKYNNYYNRILKKFDTLADYLTTPYYSGLHIDDVSFNPGDGVNTTQIIDFDPDADYVLITGDNNTILSRWFIMEAKRERTGQYNLTLHRDLLAENYDTVLTAPTYIEKAMPRIDNPLLFNNENIAVNQIKSKEILLKDKTESQWIVGYIPKNTAAITTINIQNKNVNAVSLGVPIAQWTYYKYRTDAQEKRFIVSEIDNVEYQVWYKKNYSLNQHIAYFNQDGSFNRFRTNFGDSTTLNYTPDLDIAKWTEGFLEAGSNVIYNQLVANGKAILGLSSNKDVITVANWNTLLGLNGKTVVDSNNNYYLINLKRTNRILHTYNDATKKVPTNTSLYTTLKNISEDVPGCTVIRDTANIFRTTFDYSEYQIVIEPIEEAALTTSLPATRNRCEDAMYDMFAIPYGEVRIKENDDHIYFRTNKDIAERAATAVSLSLTDGENAIQVYDLQLLPYCPVPELISDTGELDITNKDSYYSYILNGANQVGIILYPIKSRQEKFTIDTEIKINKYKNVNQEYWQVINKKESDVGDLYRLCSPNWASIFEFSVAKNNNVKGFEVDCTFKPYQPYIHINPIWDGLYIAQGEYFTDTRGLILGGDFSYGQISSAWQEYQLNNKTFQDMFDRDIKHMDTTAITGIAAGALAGGMSAASGNITGTIGAGAGIIAGGIAWQENKDYVKDKFTFNLQNIQAQPYTLTKVSAKTTTYKGWPFIEIYSCTENESDAIYNKIKYEGMSINAIGKFEDYVWDNYRTYFKGNPIRLDITEDNHYIKSLADEIYRGFYIGDDPTTPLIETYDITTNIQNAIPDINNPTTINAGTEIVLKFDAPNNCFLPETIVVEGAEYTWTRTELYEKGELKLYNATQDVYIAISGIFSNEYPIYTTLENIASYTPYLLPSMGETDVWEVRFFADQFHRFDTGSLEISGDIDHLWSAQTHGHDGTLTVLGANAPVYLNVKAFSYDDIFTVNYIDEDSEEVIKTESNRREAGMIDPTEYIEEIQGYEFVRTDPAVAFPFEDQFDELFVYYKYRGNKYNIIYDVDDTVLVSPSAPSEMYSTETLKDITIYAAKDYEVTAVSSDQATIENFREISTGVYAFDITEPTDNVVITFTTRRVEKTYYYRFYYGTGIDKIYYKTDSSTTWAQASHGGVYSITSRNPNEKVYYYATTLSGYNYEFDSPTNYGLLTIESTSSSSPTTKTISASKKPDLIGRFYYGTGIDKIYYSLNSGVTWTQASHGGLIRIADSSGFGEYTIRYYAIPKEDYMYTYDSPGNYGLLKITSTSETSPTTKTISGTRIPKVYASFSWNNQHVSAVKYSLNNGITWQNASLNGVITIPNTTGTSSVNIKYYAICNTGFEYEYDSPTNAGTLTVSSTDYNAPTRKQISETRKQYRITYSGPYIRQASPTYITYGESVNCTIYTTNRKIASVSTSNGTITNVSSLPAYNVTFTLSNVSDNPTVSFTVQ